MKEKIKLGAAAILTAFSVGADQEAYQQDISNLTQDNTIERIDEFSVDYSDVAENFRDVASGILETMEKRDENEDDVGVSDVISEISSGADEDCDIMEPHVSFEHDEPSSDLNWNAEVANVTYDQNDDE